MKYAVVTKHLHKSYGDVKVLEDLSLEFATGKITALLGPNGSGKSTLFNVLAGILPPDAGQYSIHSQKTPSLSYAFQNYREALLPWRSVRDNIALPLEIQRIPSAERSRQVDVTVNQLGISFDPNVYPYTLSGGQQQIVAFARALATHPDVLLLDEPFSALDYENTLRMRDELQEYYLATQATVLIITHDIEEATYLGGEILVLSRSPIHVFGSVTNHLPYPRTTEVMKEESFHQTKNKVLDLFKLATQL